jgi:hypothetical protein
MVAAGKVHSVEAFQKKKRPVAGPCLSTRLATAIRSHVSGRVQTWPDSRDWNCDGDFIEGRDEGFDLRKYIADRRQ